MKKSHLKTRIISILLAVITFVSVFSAAAVPASAASTSSISAQSVIKDIAKDGFGKIAKKIGGGNFFTEILADAAVSIFDSYIDGHQESDTNKSLNAVGEISDKMDSYHKEEIGMLNDLSEQIEELHDDIRTQPFLKSFDDMQTDSRRVLEALQWLESNTSGDPIDLSADGAPVIDDETYALYQTILSDRSISESALSHDITDMYYSVTCQSKELHQQNPYILLIDADARICNAKAFSYDNTVYDAPNINGSRDVIDDIQAQLLIDYAAYINLQKIDCLTQIHDDPAGAQRILSYYFRTDPITGKLMGVIPTLYSELEAIEKSYEDAAAYYDNLTAATVTVKVPGTDPVSAVYTSIPRAWAYATATGRLDARSSVTVTLNADWIPDDNGSAQGLPNQCVWRYEKPASDSYDFGTYYLESNNLSFYFPPNSSKSVPAYYSDHPAGLLTLDINGHQLVTGSGQNILTHVGIVNTLNSPATIIDSQSTGLVNGYPVSDYHVFLKLMFYSLVETDTTMTWKF